MVHRAYNFYAGPATLPLPALEKAQEELLDYNGTGMSIMELSHRSKWFDEVMNGAQDLVRELLGLGKEYHVMFLQGGASQQFALVPMNINTHGKIPDILHTGTWTKKAITEANILGGCNIVASSEDEGFRYIPTDYRINPDASYFHCCSNNTINGTQIEDFPDTGDVPLVSDMSSDFMCRELDYSKFGIIFAGAQKNIGPAGTTIVVIRDDLVGLHGVDVPTMFRYLTHIEKRSMFNTPPSFAVYMCKLCLEHLRDMGGIPAIEKKNRDKAKLLYDLIDGSGGFYKGHARKDSRSLMNVTFNLRTKELEDKCAAEALALGLVGLKGHRSVGGMRASIYNAMPREGVEFLVEFLERFQKESE